MEITLQGLKDTLFKKVRKVIDVAKSKPSYEVPIQDATLNEYVSVLTRPVNSINGFNLLDWLTSYDNNTGELGAGNNNIFYEGTLDRLGFEVVKNEERDDHISTIMFLSDFMIYLHNVGERPEIEYLENPDTYIRIDAIKLFLTDVGVPYLFDACAGDLAELVKNKLIAVGGENE